MRRRVRAYDHLIVSLQRAVNFAQILRGMAWRFIKKYQGMTIRRLDDPVFGSNEKLAAPEHLSRDLIEGKTHGAGTNGGYIL